MSALVETKNLKKIYTMGETELLVLNGINLTINKGEFVALTGASGSGKSTLMHLIGCLDQPTEGECFIDGVNVTQATKDERAKIRNTKIGFVFQKFHLLPSLTARDNVALPQLYAGKTEKEARAQATKLLDMVELDERMDHFPYQLSGGQQQRVAIARSLVNKPSILLADEPTGNLDSKTGEIIMSMFTKLNKEHGMTIMIVTHEHYIAEKTRRIIELVDGTITSDKKM